jgi:uncharacterized phage protein (TIGR02220 family)
LGDRYLDYLIDLWLTVAEDRPDGELSGWDEIDIALASGCDGNAIAYADALLECGFLDIDHRGYRIHDWSEHQGWASNAKKRSEAARKNAEKRWSTRLNDKNKCGRNADAMRRQCGRNAPSPNPSPTPIVKKRVPPEPSTDTSEVISYLNQKANRKFSLNGANASYVKARMKEGATVEQCKAVIDKKVSDWLGDPKMEQYLRPETLFNKTKFESYIQSAERKVSYAPIN